MVDKIAEWYWRIVDLCTNKECRDWLLSPPRGELGRLRTAWCRFRGHPQGVWFYNPSGLEPDMHCKNCHDDLG